MMDEMVVITTGPDAETAFEAARDADDLMRSWPGFEMIAVPDGMDPVDAVNYIFDNPEAAPFLHDENPKVGCIHLGDDAYLFMGIQGVR